MTQLRPNEVFRKFKFQKQISNAEGGLGGKITASTRSTPVSTGELTHRGCVDSSVDTSVDIGGSASLAGCTILAFGLCLMACDEI